MNVLVLYLTPPPCCHSVYSLTVFKVPKHGAVVDFSPNSTCLRPRLPAAGHQNRATSRREVSASLHGMQGYLISSASWRKVGGAIAFATGGGGTK